ncbi:LADA_0A00870g1_1 [Lachancea dasiensis]|uniref:LADA_0A00870g1_1 n=1 Tax=Lachancea dasiensis TaxID=1072105 RepID=A0A1G4ILT7_9SACH|nr:LADA_0A00870g1_1 [Lachancea dasiensis]
MAVLSSVNVTYFRVGFLSFLAFACIKDVNIILSNQSVLMFTQAMHLPALTLSSYSAQLGLFAIIFGLMALHDLVPLLEQNKMFFESIVPLRLMLFFILTTISYYVESNLFVHNNAVFIYGFCEVWINFLIFSALRDEKNEEFKKANRIVLESSPEELEPLAELEELTGDDSVQIVEE